MMLQRDDLRMVSGLETRRHGTPREDSGALLEAKDRIIAELEEQVALLSRELERKEAILSHIAEGIGELLPYRIRGAVSPSHGVREVLRDDKQGDTPETREERPTLPDGYRIVAVASNAWVLVAPRGLRVAGYRGTLDLHAVALDAREHLRCQR